MCPKHYSRDFYYSKVRQPCSLDGCEKPSHSRGLCPMHYQRQRTRGDVGIAGMERLPNIGPCAVEGCGQPMRKLIWCASHYQQHQKGHKVKPFAHKWGDGGYLATHSWICRLKGNASSHMCTDCGAQAAEWSYDGLDPDAQLDPKREMFYSRDPDRYAPRCVRCHRRFDGHPFTRKRS